MTKNPEGANETPADGGSEQQRAENASAWMPEAKEITFDATMDSEAREAQRRSAMQAAAQSEEFQRQMAESMKALAQMIEASQRWIGKLRDARHEWYQEQPTQPAYGWDDVQDIASYQPQVFSPKARLQRTPDKGRILVASEAIEACEVVIAERPLVCLPKKRANRADELGVFDGSWRLVCRLHTLPSPAHRLFDDLFDVFASRHGELIAWIHGINRRELPMGVSLTDEALARQMGICCTNAMLLRTENGDEYIAISPWLLMISHSCEANLLAVFDGEHAFVQAGRPIDKGEELTIGYVDGGMAFPKRRQTLLAGFGFVCQCPKCKREAQNTSSPA